MSIQEVGAAAVFLCHEGFITCGDGFFFVKGYSAETNIPVIWMYKNHKLWEGGQGRHEEENYSDADSIGDAAGNDAGDGECGDHYTVSESYL